MYVCIVLIVISTCKKGFEAESKAAYLLRNNDYQILARNIRFYGVEIDFICKKEEVYTFFEIKKTKLRHYLAGFAGISYRQHNRYQKSINEWFGDIQKIVMVNIGLVILDENLKLIELHKNLFLTK